MFKKLNLKSWRQFDNIDIEFHDHLTILTGANGSGKSTVLNVLAQQLGWNTQFVSSYERDNFGISHYVNSIWKGIKNIFSYNNSSPYIFGTIEVDDNDTIKLSLPKELNSGTYTINAIGQKIQNGVFIHSNRPNFSYKKIDSIPLHTLTRDDIFKKYKDYIETYIDDNFRNSNEMSASILIKSALASLALFSGGTDSVIKSPEAEKLLHGYIEVLKILLPPSLGFESIKFDNPEIILKTRSGDFTLDAVSGGIASIINISWQLFMFADPNERFTALLDEPENHLHPALQKSLLGNLIKAFPNVQFIVATHNPFMITSQRDSYVYVLKYNERERVYSEILDYINKASTSNEILRDVLGIESSLPFWAEEGLEAIIKKYSSIELSRESLNALKDELIQIGLQQYIPSTIAKTIK